MGMYKKVKWQLSLSGSLESHHHSWPGRKPPRISPIGAVLLFKWSNIRVTSRLILMICGRSWTGMRRSSSTRPSASSFYVSLPPREGLIGQQTTTKTSLMISLKNMMMLKMDSSQSQKCHALSKKHLVHPSL
jgi:hypothetical protein